jgi:hypothetical protein
MKIGANQGCARCPFVLETRADKLDRQQIKASLNQKEPGASPLPSSHFKRYRPYLVKPQKTSRIMPSSFRVRMSPTR